MKAQKKPVEIDFFSIERNLDWDNISALKEWVESFGDIYKDHFDFVDEGPDGGNLKVFTLEGTSYSVTPEDVIIRGVANEYYPCKKSIFKDTYNYEGNIR